MALLIISVVKATRHAITDSLSDEPAVHLDKHNRPRRGLVYTPVYAGVSSLARRTRKGKGKDAGKGEDAEDVGMNAPAQDDAYAVESGTSGAHTPLSPIEYDTKHGPSPLERDVKAHPTPFDDPPPYPSAAASSSTPHAASAAYSAPASGYTAYSSASASPASSASAYASLTPAPVHASGTPARAPPAGESNPVRRAVPPAPASSTASSAMPAVSPFAGSVGPRAERHDPREGMGLKAIVFGRS